jgi:hypothetical protein
MLQRQRASTRLLVGFANCGPSRTVSCLPPPCARNAQFQFSRSPDYRSIQQYGAPAESRPITHGLHSDFGLPRSQHRQSVGVTLAKERKIRRVIAAPSFASSVVRHDPSELRTPARSLRARGGELVRKANRLTELARSRVPVAVVARRKTARDKRECLIRRRDQKQRRRWQWPRRHLSGQHHGGGARRGRLARGQSVAAYGASPAAMVVDIGETNFSRPRLCRLGDSVCRSAVLTFRDGRRELWKAACGLSNGACKGLACRCRC